MDAAKEEERHTRGVETGPFFFFFLSKRDAVCGIRWEGVKRGLELM